MVSRRLVFAATVLLLLACSAEAGWGKKKQAAEVSLPPSGGAPLLDRASEALERAGHGGLVQRKGESACSRPQTRAPAPAVRDSRQIPPPCRRAHALAEFAAPPRLAAANGDHGLPLAPRQAPKAQGWVLPDFTLPLASKVLTLYAVMTAAACA